MTMARMLERFYAVESGEDVHTLIEGLGRGDDSVEGNPITLLDDGADLDAVWEDAGRRCHVCSGQLDCADSMDSPSPSPCEC